MYFIVFYIFIVLLYEYLYIQTMSLALKYLYNYVTGLYIDVVCYSVLYAIFTINCFLFFF